MVRPCVSLPSPRPAYSSHPPSSPRAPASTTFLPTRKQSRGQQGVEQPLTFEQEQAKWLEDAVGSVRQQEFFMKRSLDASHLKEALKHASNMICELRTSLLSPKAYNELCTLSVKQKRRAGAQPLHFFLSSGTSSSDLLPRPSPRLLLPGSDHYVFMALKHLEGYFLDEARSGKDMFEYYELVQHAGNILPRL